ncbi:MAG: hypothetical protein ACPG4X_21840 [Pikeienuella sp.]
MKRYFSLLSVPFVLSACTMTEGPLTEAGYIRDLPEQVIALVAPWQDLTMVLLSPDDSCYWYRHQGPVEATMIPLRSVSGGKICVQREDATPATS